MEKHTCKTYFSVNFEFDRKANVELLRLRRDCTPEELGIFNKAEVERFIVEKLGVTPRWCRHSFVIGYNDSYDVDVNKMIRVTLSGLFGKEDLIKELQQKFALTAVLEIVPYIAAESEEPKQYLTLEKDVINFLYKSDTAMDLDYYVI